MPPATRLRKLLLDLFPDDATLRLFVEDHYPTIKNAVSWGRGLVFVAQDVATRLVARGEVNRTLFDRLAGDIPGQSQRIRAEQEALGLEGLVGLGASVESAAGARPAEGLQAIVDARHGLGDPIAFLAGIADAMRRTAMVEIEGRPAGTGFLVGERHVLTNAHVVGATTGPPPADLSLAAVFDFYAGGLVSHAARGTRVRGQIVAYSLPTSAEVAGDSTEWDAPADRLDYALVELADPVGSQAGGPESLASLQAGTPRGYFPLSDAPYDVSRSGLLIVAQHPLGERMALSKATPRYDVNPRRTRLRYNANTLNGSSGSSVIDDRGHLVGLHQFAATGRNQGVLVSAIATDLKRRGFERLVTD